jgi:hypothetical protein
MDYEFVFKKGKYKGKTVEWVEDNDPSYMVWVDECAPELLKDDSEKKEEKVKSKYKEPEVDSVDSAIKPNLNFDNEIDTFFVELRKKQKIIS